MKIKGISFFEQHVEKFVLGLFGLVVVAILAMQFLTSPNRVNMGGKDVDPGDIAPQLKSKAESISARLSGNAEVPPLVEGELPLAHPQVKDALARGISPRRSLPVSAPALAAAILPSDVTTAEARFYVPALAAPSMLGVRQENDTIEDATITQFPELAARFKDSIGPKDITWAIPVASVDTKAMRQEFRRGVPDAKPPVLPVPGLWYNDALWIVDLVFERQQRQSDGSWGDAEMVAVLPGQFSFRKEIPTADAPLRDEMFRQLGQPAKAVQVLQPDFLPTKGNVFSPATILGSADFGGTAAAPTGEDQAVRRVRRELNRKEIELARIADQMKEAGGPCEPKAPENPGRERRDSGDGSSGGGGGGAGAPGGGGLGGGGFSGGKNKGGDRALDEAERKRCEALTRRWKALGEDVANLQADLAKLAPGAVGAKSGATFDLAKDDHVVVWAHDIDVTPGATYRYRSRVEAFNPFFTRKRQLVKDQQPLADTFVLRSAWSEWSPPVMVEPPVSFFVTAAGANDGRLGLGSATVEVFRFYDGVRRMETFSVQPGDRIGGKGDRSKGDQPIIDFTTDWYVVGIVDDPSGERSDRQRVAQVLVRRVGEDRGWLIRSPRDDAAAEDRVRFLDEAESAKPAAKADAPKDPAAGGDKPRGRGDQPARPGGGFGGG
jgi:uncharacterized membrane protein YgcG